MTLKGYTVENPIDILTEDQIERIHHTTLEILEQTGARFEQEKALEVLDDAGCMVDHEDQMVRFPPALVEDCIGKCPSSFVYRAREAKNNVRMGGNRVYFGPWVAMNKGNPETGDRIRPTRQQAAEAVRIVDALDRVHFGYGVYFDLRDVDPIMQIPTKQAISMRNSSKLGFGLTDYDCDIWEIKMAQATNQELVGGPTCSPPLTWSKGVMDSVFRYLEVGFPIWPMGGQNYGATSPATLAGSLALNNAETLSMLVLVQVVNPGNRFLAYNYSQPLSMRTGQPLFGAIEKGINGMAFAQLYRHYGIPRGALNSSDSKTADYECGYEKGMTTLLNALSGNNFISVGGGVYDELTWSPEVLVMDNDVFGMIGRVIEGIEVTDETLAVDLITETGPIPGHYLTKAHTRKWWMHELFMPDIPDRRSHQEWLEAGSRTNLERARERVEEILATHQPTPLTEDQDKAIDEILEEARSYFKERGML